MNEDCPRCQGLARHLADRLDRADELANFRVQIRFLIPHIRKYANKITPEDIADALDALLAGDKSKLPPRP